MVLPADTDLPPSAEDVLTTMRSMCKRLDLERPVSPELPPTARGIARQAPPDSNRWRMLLREGWGGR